MPSFFFLNTLLQAHSKAKQVDHMSNFSLLLKELAKIKYTNIKKVSKAHLPGNHLKVEPDSYHDLL